MRSELWFGGRLKSGWRGQAGRVIPAAPGGVSGVCSSRAASDATATWWV